MKDGDEDECRGNEEAEVEITWVNVLFIMGSCVFQRKKSWFWGAANLERNNVTLPLSNYEDLS